MIIKGNKVNPCRRCGSSRSLAEHLQRTDTNERVDIHELRGFASGDLEGAFAEINGTAAGTRAQLAAYHAKINPALGESLTRGQAQEAADTLEHALGFDGQPRALVEHIKEGRQHFHVVWSRVDLEKMTAIDTPENFATHERVARELEREFKLTSVKGVHGREQGSVRPERNSPEWEYQQADRLKTKSPRVQKTEITAIYNESKNGEELKAALEKSGYSLAKGDKAGVFLVVDERGGWASLTRRVEGAKAADVREKLADLDCAKLPTLEQVREQAALRDVVQSQARAAQEVTAHKTNEAPKPTQERTPRAETTGDIINNARAEAGSVSDLVTTLRGRGLAVARVTEDEATQTYIDHVIAKRAGRYSPECFKDDLVVLGEKGQIFRLTPDERDDKKPWMAAKGVEDMTPQQKAQAEKSFDTWKDKSGRKKSGFGFEEYVDYVQKEHKDTKQNLDFKAFDSSALPTLTETQEAQRTKAEEQRNPTYAKAADELDGITRDIFHVADQGLRVTGGVMNGAGKLLDTVMDFADAILSLFDPPSPRVITPQEMFRNAEARKEREAQIEAEQERSAAIGRMAETIRKSNSVSAADLHALNRDDLEQIKMRGDDHVLMMVRQHEKEQTRQHERMLER